MSVGVEHGSGAESGAYGVAKSVVNREVDVKAVDVTRCYIVVHQLRIKSGMCVANAVGVEACTGADARGGNPEKTLEQKKELPGCTAEVMP